MKDCRIKRILDNIGYDKLKWLVDEDLRLMDSEKGDEIPRALIELYLKDKEKEDRNES